MDHLNWEDIWKKHAKEIESRGPKDWKVNSRFFYISSKYGSDFFKGSIFDTILRTVKEKEIINAVNSRLRDTLSNQPLTLDHIDEKVDQDVCKEIASQIFKFAKKHDTFSTYDKEHLNTILRDHKLLTYISDELLQQKNNVKITDEATFTHVQNITLILKYLENTKHRNTKKPQHATKNKNTKDPQNTKNKEVEKLRKQQNIEQQQQAETKYHLESMKNITIPELKQFLKDNEKYLHPKTITKWGSEITKGEEMVTNKDTYSYEEVKEQYRKLSTAKAKLNNSIEKQRNLKSELTILCSTLEWKLQKLKEQGVLGDEDPINKEVEQYITDIRPVIEDDFVFRKTFMWIHWQQWATMQSNLKQIDTMLDDYIKQLWKLEKDELNKDRISAKKEEQITTAQKKEERKRKVIKQIKEMKKNWYTLFSTFLETAKKARKQKHDINKNIRKTKTGQKQTTLKTKWKQERKDIKREAKNQREINKKNTEGKIALQGQKNQTAVAKEAVKTQKYQTKEEQWIQKQETIKAQGSEKIKTIQDKAKNQREINEKNTEGKIALQEQKNQTAIAKEAVKTQKYQTKEEQWIQQQETAKAEGDAKRELIWNKKDKQKEVIDTHYEHQGKLVKQAPLDTSIFRINTSPEQLEIIKKITKSIKDIFSRIRSKYYRHSNQKKGNTQTPPEEVITPEEVTPTEDLTENSTSKKVITLPEIKQLPENTTTQNLLWEGT